MLSDPTVSDLYTTCKRKSFCFQSDSFKTERLVCVGGWTDGHG